MRMKKLLFVSVITSYLIAVNVNAAEQDFQFHGFIAQGLIDVNGSDLVNDDSALSPKLTEIGLNGSYQLSDNLRLAGQVVYLNGGNRYEEGIRVDYALLDWSAYDSLNWQTNLYFGRFKNNHWLYSSSRDIPFARPSIILPQSIYFDGFRDFAIGADGAAIKIRHHNDDFGNFDFNFTYGTSPVSDKQTELLLSDFAQGKAKQDSDMQVSLYWQPSFSAWKFGTSYLDSDFSYQRNDSDDMFFDADFSFQSYTLNALYEGEYWEFSSEVSQSNFRTKGFYLPQYDQTPISQGIYVQSRYKVTNELTLLARYEHFYNDKSDKKGKKLTEQTDGKIPAYFGYHRDTTFGLSYELTNNLRLRFEYHWVEGAGRLSSLVMPKPDVNDKSNWQLWAIQLMYWF